MPEGVTDRKAEVWRALLAVADAAGGDWPKRAREACAHFALGAAASGVSLGVRLLADAAAAARSARGHAPQHRGPQEPASASAAGGRGSPGGPAAAAAVTEARHVIPGEIIRVGTVAHGPDRPRDRLDKRTARH